MRVSFRTAEKFILGFNFFILQGYSHNDLKMRQKSHWSAGREHHMSSLQPLQVRQKHSVWHAFIKLVQWAGAPTRDEQCCTGTALSHAGWGPVLDSHTPQKYCSSADSSAPHAYCLPHHAAVQEYLLVCTPPWKQKLLCMKFGDNIKISLLQCNATQP